MGSKSKAPAPPDPVATANAQAAANADTARLQATLNRVNQVTPYGNLTYSTAGQDWVNQELEKRRQAFVPSQTTAGPQQWGITGQNSDGQATYGWTGGGTTTGPTTFDEAGVRAELEKSNPYKDQWTATTSLSPDQQKIFDEQQALSLALSKLGNQYTSRIADSTRDPFSLEGLPAAPQADDAARQRIEQSLFDRLNPQMDQQRAALESRLQNQGITLGSEAWQKGMDDFGRQQNDLRLATVAQGGNEMARLFGLETTARQNALNERLLQRNQPINEVSALLGTSGGVQMPQFNNVPQAQVAPTDVTGPTYANYQGQLANWQQQQQAGNAAMGGLFGLGSAALGGWGMGGFKKFW